MEFQEFPKIARLSREIVVTEKIDGTNAQVFISEDGKVMAGSRNRWITPQDDNYGFAAWVEAHKDELIQMGPGRHFGEWWGQGIQRKYGMTEKRFSLFNISRWCLYNQEPEMIPTADPRVTKVQDRLPECCHLVPQLYRGMFSELDILRCLVDLKNSGSAASPGFMYPEGIVIFHTAANVGFKKTIEKDEVPKSRVAGVAKTQLEYAKVLISD